MNKKLKWILIGVAVAVTAGGIVWGTLFRYRPVSGNDIVGVWKFAGGHFGIRNWRTPIRSYEHRRKQLRESQMRDADLHIMFTANDEYTALRVESYGLAWGHVGTYHLDESFIHRIRTGHSAKEKGPRIEKNAFHLKLYYSVPHPDSYGFGLWNKMKMSPEDVIMKAKAAGLLTNSPAVKAP